MAMTRQDIINYIALHTGTSRKQAALMLETLVRLAHREARNGFVIPGLCRVDVVQRKARRGRNPKTGAVIEIPAREVLRIRPLKKARESVERMPRIGAAPVEEPAPPPPAPPSAAEPEVPPEPMYVTFKCTSCRQEIEASTDMAGMATQCPGCGAPIKVPSAAALSEFARIEEVKEPAPAAPQGGGEEDYQKGSTIRIEVPDSYKMPGPVKRTVIIKRRT
ncbi:MAG: HU family DNA-binding protein [Kiritimatiellae bacterium]|nr:HU family DNA-binding protein [Kiritimatiellia bacterium]